MLHLAAPTDAGWFDRVCADLDTILVDHTHLEKRAASNALSMIFRYIERLDLVRALSEIVHEEMEHFTQMLDVLEARGIYFDRLSPAPYAATLVGHARRDEPDALLDKLLISGLIEARSCERFQILAARLEDRELADFYADLARQEAVHHVTYTNLARQYFGEEVVKTRLQELAQKESEALAAGRGEPRLHSF